METIRSVEEHLESRAGKPITNEVREHANVFHAVETHIFEAVTRILDDLELVMEPKQFRKIRARVLREANQAFRKCSYSIHQDRDENATPIYEPSGVIESHMLVALEEQRESQ